MKTNIFTLWMMGLLLVPLSAQAQTSGTTGPLQWNYHADTKTLAVTGTGVMPDYTSKDDQPWKAFRAEIEKITIADGVKTVGKRAFYECSKLTSITLPASVTELGYQAFSKCTALKNIALPSGIKTIRSQAFVNCTALTTFDVDAGNMHIAGIYIEGCQGRAVDKCLAPDRFYPGGKCNVFQCRTLGEGLITQLGNRGWQGDTCQFRAFVEGPFSNRFNTVRNSYLFDFGTESLPGLIIFRGIVRHDSRSGDGKGFGVSMVVPLKRPGGTACLCLCTEGH